MEEEKSCCCCGGMDKTTLRQPEEKKKLLNRLKRIEGQVRGHIHRRPPLGAKPDHDGLAIGLRVLRLGQILVEALHRWLFGSQGGQQGLALRFLRRYHVIFCNGIKFPQGLFPFFYLLPGKALARSSLSRHGETGPFLDKMIKYVTKRIES